MKKLILVILTVLICSKPVYATERKVDCDLLRRAFIEAMLDKIGNAVRSHGTDRLWTRGKEEILEVKQPDPKNLTRFIVTVRVETFEGAHNPPRAFETMTIDLPSGEVLSYKIRWNN
ncbi:DUF3888 domain-containing protein [Brevibacillus ruminantium]|uniref:DUF3888 domain-containing protein n=1 Tax=Brevibacillus ruminantium TaxID=2950604 RepID=A0ABY4WQR6_9BACL|nr:DUF3888 domain-containing protein [Brevibacillus ruminantium]USG67759.1 DUF3888 domain-containing protein [Brevibacillus ruminantium]